MLGMFIPEFPGRIDRERKEYAVRVVYHGEGPLDGTESIERAPLQYTAEMHSGIFASEAGIFSMKCSIRERVSKYNRGLQNIRLEETIENSIEGLKAKAILADLEISENGRKELASVVQI